MKVKYIMIISLIAGILSACESRVDWYEQLNTSAEITLEEVGNKDAIPGDTIDVSMRYGEKKEITYSINDNFSIDNNYVFYLKNFDVADLLVQQDAAAGVIRIISNADTTLQDEKTYTHKIPMYVKDYYEKESVALIRLTLKANEAPIPALEYNAVTSGGANAQYEFEFSAEESIDPDGDEIVAYEYLFDGTPRNSKYAYIYETDANGKEIKNHMPGYAAYGGTYIYATKFAAVKHAFQSAGNHTAYVRCKDSWGCWSTWKELKLVIKE